MESFIQLVKLQTLEKKNMLEYFWSVIRETSLKANHLKIHTVPFNVIKFRFSHLHTQRLKM